MISVTRLLDQAQDAIDVIQHTLSQLGWRDLAEDQVAALDGISDDLRALSSLARVCARAVAPATDAATGVGTWRAPPAAEADASTTILGC